MDIKTESAISSQHNPNSAAIAQLQAQIEMLAEKLRLESVLLDANSILLRLTQQYLAEKRTASQVQADYLAELQTLRHDHVTNFENLLKARRAILKNGEVIPLTQELIAQETQKFRKAIDEYLGLRARTFPQSIGQTSMQTLHTDLEARSNKLTRVCDQWLNEKEKMTEQLYALLEGHELVAPQIVPSSKAKAGGASLDRYVCVRIWLPRYSGDRPRVGHASLEIVDRRQDQPLTYISFWPSATPRTPVTAVPSTLHTHQQDIDSEYDELADIVVNLYTLNINRINTDNIQSTPYQLSASLWNSKAGNCVSVVYDLLKQAQLYERFPDLPRPQMLTPANLGELVLLAKQKENTKAFDTQVIDRQLLACLQSQNYAEALEKQPIEFQRLYTSQLLAKVRAYSVRGDKKGFDAFIHTFSSETHQTEQIQQLKPKLLQLFNSSLAEYNNRRVAEFETLLNNQEFDRLYKELRADRVKGNSVSEELLRTYNDKYCTFLGRTAIDPTLSLAWSSLKTAIDRGDTATVNTVLTQHPALWIKEVQGPLYTPFHYACQYGSFTVANNLLQQLNQQPALLAAVKSLPRPLGWNPKFLEEKLLGLCQDPHKKWTSEQRVMQVKQVLDLGADVNTTGSRTLTTVLHYAAENNDAALVAVLLEYGADVNVTTMLGDSPLHTLAKQPQVEVAVAEHLIAAGINPTLRNKAYDTAKEIAEKNGHTALVQKLQPGQNTSIAGQLYRGMMASALPLQSGPSIQTDPALIAFSEEERGLDRGP